MRDMKSHFWTKPKCFSRSRRRRRRWFWIWMADLRWRIREGFFCRSIPQIHHYPVSSQRSHETLRLSSSEWEMFCSNWQASGWTKRQETQASEPWKSVSLHPVPSYIQRPPYVNSRQAPEISGNPEVHDKKGMDCMRASGQLAAQVLEYACTLVKPSIKTDDIDQAVHKMIIDNGADQSPLGYVGFPKSVCTSVNECICHGIPDSYALEDCDIINIDVAVYLNKSR